MRDDGALVDDRRRRRWRQRPATENAADEPLTAEREAAHNAQPHTVTVGPRTPHPTDDVEQ